MFLRLILLVTVIGLLGKLLRPLFRTPTGRKIASPLVQDPICGLYIEPQNAEETLEVDGKKIYFCSSSCAQTFRSRLKSGESILPPGKENG
jgi:YHS domain-containing protein